MRSIVRTVLFFVIVFSLIAVAIPVQATEPPDTGQNHCYGANGGSLACPSPGDPLFGQDANYVTSEPAYEFNGDGTITDLNTGLMWQQTPGAKVTWPQAMADATMLNLAGYTDWRVPTITELYSLINFNGVTGASEDTSIPYIDRGYFDFEYGNLDAGERLIDAQYWSRTEYVSLTMDGIHTIFGVNFADGRIKGYGTADPLGNEHLMFVRYVRGERYGITALVDNGDGTITDQNSGLTWMQADSGAFSAGPRNDGSLNWPQALAFCENLDYAGQTDWRLPDAKELQGIVDYTRAPDTTNSAAIDPLFTTTAITNEGGTVDYPYFWTSTTHLDGRNLGSAAVYVAFGRALGYMETPNGGTRLMDVHGAGAQRSDPKDGDPTQYAGGRGPQGDVIRIYNYARCVRGGAVQTFTGGEPDTLIRQLEAAQGAPIGGDLPGGQSGQTGQPGQQGQLGGQPPQEAIDACVGLGTGTACTINAPRGALGGTCMLVQNVVACVP